MKFGKLYTFIKWLNTHTVSQSAVIQFSAERSKCITNDVDDNSFIGQNEHDDNN